MSETLWYRLAASTGIIFVVLIAVGFLVVGEPPLDAAASNDAIKAYYVGNRATLLAQSYLQGLAAIAFLWFVGALRSALRGAEVGSGRLSATAFGGGVALVAVAMVGNLFHTALAYRLADESIPVARAFFDLQALTYTLTYFPGVVLVGAASVLMLRTGALVRWWGGVGLLVAVLLLVGGAGVTTSSGPLAAGGDVGFAAFGAFLAWVLVTSIMMVASPPRETEAE